MTVCVAALCNGGKEAVGIYDCLMTYADNTEYETPDHKAVQVDDGTLILIAGDGDLQTEIIQHLNELIKQKKKKPHSRLLVSEIAKLYEDSYRSVRQAKAEKAILSKQGLTYESYISQQKDLNENFCDNLAKELAEFSLPIISAIIVGMDNSGAHLFVFEYSSSIEDYELLSKDSQGYACIGSGARLAEDVFITDKFTPDKHLPDVLFTSYVAKKQAENATGVGTKTRIFKIIPDDLIFLWEKPVFMKIIKNAYSNLTKKIELANNEARKQIDIDVGKAIEETTKQLIARKASTKSTS